MPHSIWRRKNQPGGNPLSEREVQRSPDVQANAQANFELAINLKTANALGLIVLDRLLALADEMIE